MGSPDPAPKYSLPKMPSYEEYPVEDLYWDAIKKDQHGYQLSDQDFARRNPNLVKANKMFQQRALDAQSGTDVLPEIQNMWMRSGIARTLGSFGDNTGTLALGSAGEANLARNLGINMLDFQRQNEDRANQYIGLGNSLFERRDFGMGGEGAVQLALANIAGKNNFNQAVYANKVQNEQFNAGVDAQNSATAASNRNSQIAGGATAVAVAAVIAFCWVAREVYGEENPKWLLFRHWMRNNAPDWLFNFYCAFGEGFAEFISDKEYIKGPIGRWMDGRIAALT